MIMRALGIDMLYFSGSASWPDALAADVLWKGGDVIAIKMAGSRSLADMCWHSLTSLKAKGVFYE